MNRFVEKHSAKLLGVISGFDRLVLKGTLRPLSYIRGMMNFLWEKQVLLKDFGPLRRRGERAIEADLPAGG